MFSQVLSVRKRSNFGTILKVFNCHLSPSSRIRCFKGTGTNYNLKSMYSWFFLTPPCRMEQWRPLCTLTLNGMRFQCGLVGLSEIFGKMWSSLSSHHIPAISSLSDFDGYLHQNWSSLSPWKLLCWVSPTFGQTSDSCRAQEVAEPKEEGRRAGAAAVWEDVCV